MSPSVQNLFSCLFLFCLIQWKPSHPQPSGIAKNMDWGEGGDYTWPSFSNFSVGWWALCYRPHLMLSTSREAFICKWYLAGQHRAKQLSPGCLLWVIHAPAGTQLVGSEFYFWHPKPIEKHQEHLLVINTRAPVQVNQKFKPKGESAGRAYMECWTQALIRNTGALDRASLYKLLGPVFTS